MDGPANLSSRRGRRVYVLTVLAGLFLPLSLLVALDLALARDYVGAAMALLVATLHFRMVAIVPTIRIEVDQEGVSGSHLFGAQRFSWGEVTAVSVEPTGFSASNVLVRTQRGHYRLMVALVDNHRDMAVAIVRHAVAANPVIQVKGTGRIQSVVATPRFWRC